MRLPLICLHCISFLLQIEDAREEYFEQQSSKCVTSDHTLSKLNMPQMDQQVSLKGQYQELHRCT